MYRTLLGVGIAVLLLATAQAGVRRAADEQRAGWPKLVGEPYSPSPAAAPYVTLGYRELAADIFWVRAKTYSGGDDDTAAGLRGLIDAIVALDPAFLPPYEFGARSIGFVDGGTTQDDIRWSVELLEQAIPRFPDRWQLPFLAGQVYLIDLETEDSEQRAEWDDRGARLLERAIRMPGAPRDLGTLVAHVRTNLGQRERAVRDLKELILITDHEATRQKLIEKLATLQGSNADAIGDEIHWMRERFEDARLRAMPEAPSAMYVLLGDPPPPYIDLRELARDPAEIRFEETFEPVE